MISTQRKNAKTQKLTDFTPFFPEWQPTQSEDGYTLQHSSGAELIFQVEGDRLIVGQSWWCGRKWLLAYLPNKDSVKTELSCNWQRPIAEIAQDIERKLVTGFPKRYERLKHHHLALQEQLKVARQKAGQLALLVEELPDINDDTAFSAQFESVLERVTVECRVIPGNRPTAELAVRGIRIEETEKILQYLVKEHGQ